MSELNNRLIIEVRKFQPNHVFEFGFGNGKNLKPLASKAISTLGLDISMMNVIHAHCLFELPGIMKADESYLRHLVNFDVVITCSVLDHIENIDGIVQELQRIANKSVIIAEAQLDSPETHYYYHNYEKYGFIDIGYKYISEKPAGDGNEYRIWIWRKGQTMGETGNSFVNDDLAK
jgi:2-polyprenyl-3-methyl-5-hydroxy-6-metoxy-1,4-benzoquinol methylase